MQGINHFVRSNIYNFGCARRCHTNFKQKMITTPIFYVNGPPHIGHVYSVTLADAMARWFRFTGEKTLFTTGTDEHGGKVHSSAEKHHVTPKQWCDQVSSGFRSLFDKIHISYDDFIRTTEDRHFGAVESMWNRLKDSGDIYLGEYSGWYCVSDESFLTPNQVLDVKDEKGNIIKVSSESGHVVHWVTEKNYMFKLSKYRERLLQWLDENDVVVPLGRANEVRGTLADLTDLSISRPKHRISWGIPVPGDPEHVIYVWLDALTNYLTVAGFPDSEKLNRSWPADVQVIGKDILKFHCIYWPAFLMAAELPLPKKIVAHGHWTSNREKMSKSKGNVVDPEKFILKYGVDSLRYFLLSEAGVSHDGDFDISVFLNRYNSDLANTFGNLFVRVTSSALNPDNLWPSVEQSSFMDEDKSIIEKISELPKKVAPFFSEMNFPRAIEIIFELLRMMNKYFYVNEPWKLAPKGENHTQDKTRLRTVLYITIEALRIVALVLQPIIPSTTDKVLDHFGVEKINRNMTDATFGYHFISIHGPVPKKAIILFPKI